MSLISLIEKRGKKTKLQSDVEAIIKRTIDCYYSQKECMTIKDLHFRVIKMIDQVNHFRDPKDKLVVPSYQTIRNRIIHYHLNDSITNIQKNKYIQQKVSMIYKPLSIVKVDHFSLDFMVVDESTKLPLGRPWITIIMDCFSGYPLGVYIGFEFPSYKSVLLALKDAIFPKGYLKEKFPTVKNEWHAYGLPETLIVDSGKEFRSNDLIDTCHQLSISLAYSADKFPENNGAMERFFKEVGVTLTNKIKGTTFENVTIKDQPAIEFDKFQLLFYTWLVDCYSNDFNKSVGGIPTVIWRENMKNTLNHLPLENSEILFMDKMHGSIQRYGIRSLNLKYASPMLLQLYLKLQVAKKENRVMFRVNPEDLSCIYVYDQFEKKYFKVPSVNQEYTKDLKLSTHMAVLKRSNEERRKVDINHLQAIQDNIRSIIEDQIKLTKKSNNKN
ncbi:Mu transposase C-terminal domain-containing protein [Neobacillus drentensis]|uniref:Mu transposase C-terminal domain-containing protein n=1 Tax=Neobacillus drentensis TaxID=220684 RepID=UPI002FFF70DD